MFSIGSGDERDGHLEDHDLLSSVSCETVEHDVSGCCGVEEIPSSSLAFASSFAKDEAARVCPLDAGSDRDTSECTARLAVESIMSNIICFGRP